MFQMIAISDVDTVIAADGYAYHYIGGVNNGALPVTYHNLPYTSSVVFYSGGYLNMNFNEASGNTRNLTGSIWVEYTKTTD